ncbi:transcriptional regulator, TetR family [Faunimonas pinastri]|uniref:Transcriptional regulator, TetR family n=1 Tax=Faunimonas pinastri TaxID=1855383 RepID=A0A1H9EAD8_9HYPH|nr:TetR/AcrR family transcriptional regulator [Faunimonas pinastri]SEQ22625.1 transcriptional regulator, TetR family [Faunimonas pinastri]
MTAALDRAVLVFREHGYDGTSIDALKAATDLTAGSLYKAFKDKKHIFALAFARYLDVRRNQLAERLAGAGTGRERLAETLRFYLDSASGAEGRKGCLVLGSLVEVEALDPALRAALGDAVTDNRAMLLAMLRDGQRDGSVRADLEVEPCADLLLSLLHGLRAVGKLGDPAGQEALVALALKMLD